MRIFLRAANEPAVRIDAMSGEQILPEERLLQQRRKRNLQETEIRADLGNEEPRLSDSAFP